VHLDDGFCSQLLLRRLEVSSSLGIEYPQHSLETVEYYLG
jgi:hypothetical protein